MKPTGVDLIMFLILMFLFIGPWTWMNKISIKTEKWVCNFFIYLGFPVIAFMLTFGLNGFFDPNKVLAANDGSFGFMQSEHYRLAAPGGYGWNPLYWLGEDEGPYPISIYYILVWISNNPDVVLSLVFLVFSILGVVRYMKTKNPSI